MDKTILKNLYSHNIIFDDVVPLKQMNESYNFRLVNDIYVYKNSMKDLTPVTESETTNTLIKNHINSFLHGSCTGSLHDQYTN